jgi:hypothetical protein
MLFLVSQADLKVQPTRESIVVVLLRCQKLKVEEDQEQVLKEYLGILRQRRFKMMMKTID